MLKIGLFGAAGRMGRTIVRCIAEHSDLQTVSAVTIPGDPQLGTDVGALAGVAVLDVLLSDDPVAAMQGAQVAIDFTLPDALRANLDACVRTGTPLVIGTTGLSDRDFAAIDAAAREIPLVYARNMSVGVNVFMALAGRAAQALGDDYDIEIVEAHHRHKRDAPSGTALAVGDVIAQIKGRRLDELAVRGRDGQTGPRVPGTIGFSVIRGGEVVGDHTVLFLGPEERLEFVHRAADRMSFARGAIRAARWVAARAPGRYSMADVLGLGANKPGPMD